MPSIYFLRTIQTLSRYASFTPAPWMVDASPLERLGLAQHVAPTLAKTAKLNPTEMLLGMNQFPVEEQCQLYAEIHRQHPSLTPEYLNTLHQPGWSLRKDPLWKELPASAQEVVCLFAAVGLNIVRTSGWPRLSEGTVFETLKEAPDITLNNPMFQRVVAANNPSLFALMLHAQTNIDPQACAIAFWHGRNIDRSWYNRIDEDSFAAMISDKQGMDWNRDQFSALLRNDTRLHFYPWERLPLILEHNPARFIASVVMNHDVANAHSHVKQWFQPMLHATAKKTLENPHYVSAMLNIALSPRGKKRLDHVLQLHAPREYEGLVMTRQLYDSSQTDILQAWLRWMAQENTLAPTSLERLDHSLFEPDIPSL